MTAPTELRRLAEAALAHAPMHEKRKGWFWHGYGSRTSKNMASVELSYWAPRWGVTNLMGFRRRGMTGAEPTFYSDGVRVESLEPLIEYEVDYRDDIAAIRHPVAEWIAAADPESVLALLDEIDRLRRWKEEAIQVDDEWRKVWDAAGHPGRLGQSKALAVAEWIKDQMR